MTPATLRHTWIGALVFGGATALVATVQVFRAGTDFADALPLLLLFVVLAATVGALAGPLVGSALSRRSRTNEK